ncbi:MAG: hypothetical protein KF804_07445 [Burkholderiales bacterium]|nr:hypothetical protein [Burkholderiales bacterium]
MQHHRRTYPSLVAQLMLVAWMLTVMLTFVLVSLSPDGALAAALPGLLLGLRDILLPLFQAPSLY